MQDAPEEPLVVHVYGSPYTVDVDGYVKIPVPGGSKPKLYRRHRPADKPAESALAMQKRIEEDIVDMSRKQVRSKFRRRLCLRCAHCC